MAGGGFRAKYREGSADPVIPGARAKAAAGNGAAGNSHHSGPVVSSAISNHVDYKPGVVSEPCANSAIPDGGMRASMW
jgi:hypothetical protein